MIPYVLLVIGFAMLIKGADLLVKGASSVARRLNVSELAIGLTVVAFGTSTPELFVNLVSSFRGNSAIAIGNILGSNTANILLILGISSIIYPLSVTKGTVWKEIPFSLLAAVVLGILSNDILIDKASTSILTRTDGLIFLSFFIIFLYYTVNIATEIHGVDEHIPTKQYSSPRSLVFIILGFFGLILGGKWIVDGAVTIATQLGVGQSLVGLTIVAVGTSLPELATSAMAAYKRNVEIAVGNVVGSNIFNIFFILGISALIKPLPFQATNNLDIAVVVFSSLLLFGFMFTGKKQSLDRWEGIVFILLYSLYVSVIAMLQ
ncbi:MAG: calcium/sodium antiporter [Deltaproteobacteria bacterium]|nr:MAG: calcium/sodium antiporter [Deltaproteobacteria bacterium]